MLTTLDAALKSDPLEAACVPANYTNVVQERPLRTLYSGQWPMVLASTTSG